MITNKIFQPPSDRVIRAGFFTSIPIATCLLAGTVGIKVNARETEGSTFTIQLPI